jgi:hypothetical protein
VTEKGHIIGSLGEEQLLLPSRINAALAANDRAKYLLTLLQTARYRAEDPEWLTSDLRSERLASGVDDVSLDEIIGDRGRRSLFSRHPAFPSATAYRREKPSASDVG